MKGQWTRAPPTGRVGPWGPGRTALHSISCGWDWSVAHRSLQEFGHRREDGWGGVPWPGKRNKCLSGPRPFTEITSRQSFNQRCPRRTKLWATAHHHYRPPEEACASARAHKRRSAQSAGRKRPVSGLNDHRYLSVTENATQRQPAGGTLTN